MWISQKIKAVYENIGTTLLIISKFKLNIENL